MGRGKLIPAQDAAKHEAHTVGGVRNESVFRRCITNRVDAGEQKSRVEMATSALSKVSGLMRGLECDSFDEGCSIGYGSGCEHKRACVLPGAWSHSPKPRV